jgi:hypothetical protein
MNKECKRVKRKRVKTYIVSLFVAFVILGVAFLWTHSQRDSQLMGSWEQSDGRYVRIFHADGSGSIEPEVHSMQWRIRGGQLIVTSMGVSRVYEYTVYNEVKLVLAATDRDGRYHSTMYVRIDE